MKELESEIKSHVLNKKITDIEFYNINDSYFEFDPKSKWIFDGGIQIKFDSAVFSYGWNFEKEGFEFSLDKSIDLLLGEAPFYNVDAKKIPGISALIGSEIIDIEFEWDYYQEFDENAELKEDKIFIPVQLLLKFKSNDFLQLALINYEIKEETFEIINAEYNLAGELFISFNHKLKIMNAFKDDAI